MVEFIILSIKKILWIGINLIGFVSKPIINKNPSPRYQPKLLEGSAIYWIRKIGWRAYFDAINKDFWNIIDTFLAEHDMEVSDGELNDWDIEMMILTGRTPAEDKEFAQPIFHIGAPSTYIWFVSIYITFLSLLIPALWGVLTGEWGFFLIVLMWAVFFIVFLTPAFFGAHYRSPDVYEMQHTTWFSMLMGPLLLTIASFIFTLACFHSEQRYIIFSDMAYSYVFLSAYGYVILCYIHLLIFIEICRFYWFVLEPVERWEEGGEEEYVLNRLNILLPDLRKAYRYDIVEAVFEVIERIRIRILEIYNEAIKTRKIVLAIYLVLVLALKNLYLLYLRADKFFGLKLLRFGAYVDFGLSFLLVFYILFFMNYMQTRKHIVSISLDGFSAFVCFEIVLLLILLLCFLTFFRSVKKYNNHPTLGVECKKVFASNVASVFAAYWIAIFFNWVAYKYPLFFTYPLYLYGWAGFNWHSQEFALLFFKLIYIFFGLMVILMLTKYLVKRIISFQYFCLVVLMLWLGLFISSMTNIFYALLLLDTLSLMSVSIISLSSTKGQTKANNFAFSYFTLSAATSILSYFGCFFIYLTIQTLNINAAVFLLKAEGVGVLASNPAFTVGVLFIIIKLMFLLGLYPFNHYVLEVSNVANYGFLFFFLVVAKFPAILVLLEVFKLAWINFSFFSNFILLAGVSSILYSSVVMIKAVRIKRFLALSSINQIGYFFALLHFKDTAAINVAILFFIIYSFSVAGLFLFFSTSRYYGRTVADGDLLYWSDLVRFTVDSYSIYILHHKGGDYDFLRKDLRYFYYFTGAFVASFGVLTLAGFPPLAGFFLKMHLSEIFIANNNLFTLATILLTSVLTIYVYYNLVVAMYSEHERFNDASRGFYVPRISMPEFFDFILFLILFFILCLLAWFIPDTNFFWTFAKNTAAFFSNNHVYANDLYVESVKAAVDASNSIAVAPTTEWSPHTYILITFCLAYPRLTSQKAPHAVNSSNGLVFTRALSNFSKSRNRSSAPSSQSKQHWLVDCYDWMWTSPSVYRYAWSNITSEFALVLWGGGMLFMAADIFLLPNFVFMTPPADTYFGGVYGWKYMLLILSYVIIYFVFLDRDNPISSTVKHRVFFAIFAPVLVFVVPNECVNTIKEIFEFLVWNVLLDNEYLKIVENFFRYKPEIASLFYYYNLGLSLLLFYIWFRIEMVYLYWKRFGHYDVKTHGLFSKIVRYEYALFYVRNASAWTNRRVPGALVYFGLLLFVGPFLSAARVFENCSWTALSVGFIYITQIILYYIWNVFNAAIYVAFANWVYCGYHNINSFKQYADHLAKFEPRPYFVNWRNNPANATKSLLWCSWAIIIPIVFGLNIRPYDDILYKLFYPTYHHLWELALSILPVLVICMFLNGFVCTIERQDMYARCVFYFSVTLSAFFTILLFDYSNGSVSRLKCNISMYDIVCMDLRVYLFESLANSVPASIFVLSYNYLSLMMCAMTCAVFTLVYYTYLGDDNMPRKRLFYSCLFLVQLFTVGAFTAGSLLVFFVYFESALFPMAFIIGYWGSSDKRWFASRQFLLYSLLASVPMLMAVVYVYSVFGTCDIIFLKLYASSFLSPLEQILIWLSIFIMLAAKIPMFPLHSWLLHAHVEAPTGGSIVLAAVLLKLGIFGMINYLLTIFPVLTKEMAPFVIALAAIGFIFSSLCSITENDAKRLVAQTSIAHMNLAVIGIFSHEFTGFYGAFLLAIGHAAVSGGLFYLVGVAYARFGVRDLNSYGGLGNIMPIFSSFLFFFIMANAGFPWSLSFVGEILVLFGIIHSTSIYFYLVVVACSVMLLYANLRLFTSLCFGNSKPEEISNAAQDLTHVELVTIFCGAFLAFSLMFGFDIYFSHMFHEFLVTDGKLFK